MNNSFGHKFGYSNDEKESIYPDTRRVPWYVKKSKIHEICVIEKNKTSDNRKLAEISQCFLRGEEYETNKCFICVKYNNHVCVSMRQEM